MTDETSGSNGNHYSEDDRSVGTPDHNLRAPEAEVGGDAADVKPLNYIEHEPGIFASEGDTEYVDPEASTTVGDYDTGKAAAVVEDEDRTYAARSRRAANLLENLPINKDEIDREIEKLGPEPKVSKFRPIKRSFDQEKKRQHRHERAQLEAELEGYKNRAREAVNQVSTYSEIAVSDVLGGNEQGRFYIEMYRDRARKADKRAKELGEWAAILHTNPPSEAFIASNSSMYGFTTPHELVEVSGDTLNAQRNIANRMRTKLEIFMKEGLSLEEATGILDGTREEFSRYENADEDEKKRFWQEHPAESRGLVKELWGMVRDTYDDDITVGQLKQKALAVCAREAEIEEVEAAALQRALEDIRSGKAADPNYKVQEIPTGQMADDLAREAHWHAGQAEKWHGIAEEREGYSQESALRTAALHAKRAEDALEVSNRRDELAAGDEMDRPAEP